MRIANWRQRLKNAFVNSTLYKWEFCLSWHAACELEHSSLAGWVLPGQWQLVHQAPQEASWAPWRWIQGQGRCLKGPLQHILAPLPYASAETALTRGKSKAAAIAPWDENTSQTTPWKILDYFCFTAVTDCRLVPTHYMGEKVVPLSSIRFFLIICATEMYRNALLYWAFSIYMIRVNLWR